MNRSAKAVLFALCACLSPARAGIDFESTVVKKEAEPQEEQADFVFKFKISGDKPVRISDVEVSCGCLQASVDHAEYRPGETGEVKATMRLGSFEGPASKSITVKTNDPEKPLIHLETVANIPTLIEFEPKVTTWKVGEAASPKTVKVKVTHKESIRILKLQSTRENVTPALKEIKEGREYEITLTPKSTESPELGLVTVETDCPIVRYTRRQIFFNVVRSSPLPGTPQK